MTAPQPQHPQPLWVYKREPAGMGEWVYRIYRNNHYMIYAESESIAMIICNVLNLDEQSHTSAGAQQQRIEQVIRELEKMRERNDRRGGEVLNFNDGVAYACDKAIALLQAGDQHE